MRLVPIKSFKNCAPTIALDGSEDHLIHCFKPNGPIPTRINVLRQSRINNYTNEIIEVLEEIDLNEDENNGYDSDVSIDIVY